MGCGASAATIARVSSNRRGKRSSRFGDQGQSLLDKYTLGGILGQGAFGIVYQATRNGTNERYAIKMIDKVETSLPKIEREIDMLEKLANPHVVKLHDVFFEKVFVCLVMDLCTGGTMIQGMQAHWSSKGVIPLRTIQRLGRQMLEGIAYIHSKEAVHRDLKGDNYLMDRKDISDPDVHIFLCDFGTVRTCTPTQRLKEHCGTQLYWSPEFYRLDYALKVDIWAIGVIMYGLLMGTFPFRNEQEVYNKVQQYRTKRCPKEGLHLLSRALEKDEVTRIDASSAVNHGFVKIKLVIPQSESNETFEFNPDIKESGANAGANDRRRELVGRIEKHAAMTQGKRLSMFNDPKLPSFEVFNKHYERTWTFEWWSADRVKDSKLLDLPWAKEAPTEEAGQHQESVLATLAYHNISTESFGKGAAMTLDEFVEEVRVGTSRLMLDAAQYKTIVRSVHLVFLRLVYSSDGNRTYLVKTKEEFGSSGRKTSHKYELPNTKKLMFENNLQTLKRLLQELQLSDCTVELDMTSKQTFEIERISASCPAVSTVYTNTIVEGRISSMDPETAATLGFPTGAFRIAGERDSVKHFEWMAESTCIAKKVALRAPDRAADASALVYAAPKGLDEEHLRLYLEENSIDSAKFQSSMKVFSDELTKGEATLVKTSAGVIRVVDIVVLHITNEKDEVLMEVKDQTKEGVITILNRLPAVKRRTDENQFWAAKRCIENWLNIDEDAVNINSTGVKMFSEVKDSAMFPGLPTMYRKRIISASLVAKGT